jgi:integrase/recombinase XerC
MNNYIESFLLYLQDVKKNSGHTVISYQNDLNAFSKYCLMQYETDDIVLINHLMIRSWIMQLKSEGISNSSINRKMSALKSFYKYLRRNEVVVINPMVKVQTLKKSKRLPSYVPKSKMEYLQEETLERDSFTAIRDELIITILYMTGIRRSELINLKTSDINDSRLELKVIGKGNKERLCPISKEVLEKIKTYVKLRDEQFGHGDHNFLIVTDKGTPSYPKLIFNVVSRILKKINASEKTSPHVLRHTFATHLSSNGAELNAIKELLGHASLAATQVYTHNTIDRLKTEYRKAHPKGE